MSGLQSWDTDELDFFAKRWHYASALDMLDEIRQRQNSKIQSYVLVADRDLNKLLEAEIPDE